MRLLELRKRDDPTVSVVLHPHLTVVRADPTKRRDLAEAIADVFAARVEHLAGAVETNGVRVELIPELLTLLVRDNDRVPVLSSEDFGGRERSLADQARSELAIARQRAARAVERLSTARAAFASANQPRTPTPEELAQAQARLEERAEAATRLLAENDDDRRRALAGARARAGALRDAEAQLVVAETALATGRAAHADPERHLHELLAAIDVEIAELASGADALRDAAIEESESEIRQRRTELAYDLDRHRNRCAELEARREELVARLRALPHGDPTELIAALAEVRGSDAVMTPDPVAHDLLEQHRTTSIRLNALRERSQRHANLVAKATARVHELMQRLESTRAVTGSSSTGELSDDDRRAIEAAHESVTSAQSRVDRRLTGLGARRQLEQSLDKEAALLRKFGFSSYADYLLSGSLPVIDQQAHREALELERELQAARASLAALENYSLPAQELAEGEEAARKVHKAIVEHLGDDPGTDLERRLSTAMVDLSPAMPRLRAAASELGIDVDGRQLVAAADDWLARRETTDDQRPAVEEALRDLDTEHHGAKVELERLTTMVYEAEQPRHLPPPSDEELVLRKRLDEARAHREHVAVTRPLPNLEALERECDRGAALVTTASSAYLEALNVVAAATAAFLQAESHRRQVVAEQRAGQLEPLSLVAPLDAGALERATVELAGAQRDATEALAALEEAQRASRDNPTDAPTADHATGLLRQLLRQVRNGSRLGSLPLVLDDPFALFPAAERAELLAWLAANTEGVQVVLLSDDDATAAWAGSLAAEAAAIIDLR